VSGVGSAAFGLASLAKSRPTVGSLFAGIGGFDLGLERAGMEIKWQVEIDPFCRAVLAKHWPDVRRYEDVRTVGAELGYVDVICGGFPCQDISTAGKGAGLAGERSGLWSEYLRLICHLRPRYVVVENVAALLARGMGTVLGDLAEGGYDAEWDCLPAVAFGAPHRRDRVWIVAYPKCGRDGESKQAIREHDKRGIRGRAQVPADAVGRDRARAVADADVGRFQVERIAEPAWLESSRGGQPDGCGQIRQQQHAAATVEHADGSGCEHAGEGHARSRVFREGERIDPAVAGAGWWDVEPDLGRVAHGVPNRVDRLKGLGNAIVPQIAEWIGRRIVEAEAATVTKVNARAFFQVNP